MTFLQKMSLKSRPKPKSGCPILTQCGRPAHFAKKNVPREAAHPSAFCSRRSSVWPAPTVKPIHQTSGRHSSNQGSPSLGKEAGPRGGWITGPLMRLRLSPVRHLRGATPRPIASEPPCRIQREESISSASDTK